MTKEQATVKIHCFCCGRARTFHVCTDVHDRSPVDSRLVVGCLHCDECGDIVQEPGSLSPRIVEGPTLPEYRVTVLDDGDNTTWAGDAFVIELTHDEYGEVHGGHDKLMRGLAAQGRPTYSAGKMLDCIRRVNRMLKAKNGTIDMIRGELRDYGFLDE